MPKAISVAARAGCHDAPARMNRAEAIIARRLMVFPRIGFTPEPSKTQPIAARRGGDLNRGGEHCRYPPKRPAQIKRRFFCVVSLRTRLANFGLCLSARRSDQSQYQNPH